MNIYKRKNSPCWWYDFQINGNRFKASTKKPLNDRKGANRVLQFEYNKRSNEILLGDKSQITLQEAAENTVSSVEGRTQGSYKLSKAKLLGEGKWDHIWHIKGSMSLSDLTQGHIDQLKRNRKNEGLKPNSINIELRFLQRVQSLHTLSYAVNPDLRFTKLKGFIKTRHISENEESQILALLEPSQGPSYEKAFDFYIFLVETGLRLDDGLTVKWADLNLDKGVMEIYRGKTRNISMVPLLENTLRILKKRHNQPHPFGEMSRAIKKLRWAIHEVCNNDPRVVETRGAATIHSLRDTYASRLASRGVSLQKISKLIGHKSMVMSQKYTHLEGADVVEEVKQVMNGS